MTEEAKHDNRYNCFDYRSEAAPAMCAACRRIETEEQSAAYERIEKVIAPFRVVGEHNYKATIKEIIKIIKNCDSNCQKRSKNLDE